MRVHPTRPGSESGLPRPVLPAVLWFQGGLLVAGLLVALLSPPGAIGWLMVLLVASSLSLLAIVMRPTHSSGPGRGREDGACGRSSPDTSETSKVERAPPASGEVVTTGDEALRRRLQGLEDDLAQRERRLGRLLAGRDRARQESRLKSDYLTLMGRELQPLMERLDEAEAQQSPPLALGDYRRLMRELRDRLGDLSVLLAGLSGDDGEAEATSLRPARVLIVDDGPVNLMLARQVLERRGLEVHTATSGAEALACLEATPFDLVLMDIFMSDMDGMETSRRWREREAIRYPDRRSVLVALTANASDEDRRRFQAAGLDDYLAKPYRPQALVDQVRRWLPDAVESHETP